MNYPHGPDYWQKFFIFGCAICIMMVVMLLYLIVTGPSKEEMSSWTRDFQNDPHLQRLYKEALEPKVQKTK